MNSTDLRKAAVAVYLTTEPEVATHLSNLLIWAANQIEQSHFSIYKSRSHSKPFPNAISFSRVASDKAYLGKVRYHP